MSAIQKFLHRESSAGLVLMGAGAFALLLANSPLGPVYNAFLGLPIVISVGDFALSKTLVHWVNDGLMAVFFFLIGLEVKREIVEGELSTVQSAALPVIAAIGGMAGPAAVYVLLNANDGGDLRGWAIPSATDIAFALGVIALLGQRVPVSLKIFLAALAIIDDIGAITIIAVFYTQELSTTALLIAGVCILGLALLNWRNVRRTDVYVAVGLVLWLAVLKSGVHATLAGVITALAVPIAKDSEGLSPLHYFEDKLHSWVQFLILPVFAFSNAGVTLTGISREALFAPVTLGVAGGLFIGKQAGIVVAVAIAQALKLASLPPMVSWVQLYGVSVITGCPPSAFVRQSGMNC